MKKLTVNNGCIGCGACIAIDSEHFDFNDEGLSSVISNENLETDELKNAIESIFKDLFELFNRDEDYYKNFAPSYLELCEIIKELKNAIASCPVNVIKLEETDECNCCDECNCNESCDCNEECHCNCEHCHCD